MTQYIPRVVDSKVSYSGFDIVLVHSLEKA